eukprot:SAG22_NODE_6205_length_886_cov_1.350699_1_plen_160_part_00
MDAPGRVLRVCACTRAGVSSHLGIGLRCLLHRRQRAQPQQRHHRRRQRCAGRRHFRNPVQLFTQRLAGLECLPTQLPNSARAGDGTLSSQRRLVSSSWRRHAGALTGRPTGPHRRPPVPAAARGDPGQRALGAAGTAGPSLSTSSQIAFFRLRQPCILY